TKEVFARCFMSKPADPVVAPAEELRLEKQYSVTPQHRHALKTLPPPSQEVLKNMSLNKFMYNDEVARLFPVRSLSPLQTIIADLPEDNAMLANANLMDLLYLYEDVTDPK